MTHSPSSRARVLELTSLLERNWDIEFDPQYDDLEREFAELRFQLHSHANGTY